MVAIQTVSLKPMLLQRQNLYKKADVVFAVSERKIIFCLRIYSPAARDDNDYHHQQKRDHFTAILPNSPKTKFSPK